MCVFRNGLVIVLILGILFLSQCSMLPQRPVRAEAVARWEPFMFKGIDKTVELSGMEHLRDKRIKKGEYEIRIWRGFGLGDLEMVVLRNADGGWSGDHIIANDYVEITETKVTALPTPKLGWQTFGELLSQLGLFNLETSYDDDCWTGIDGTSHVVEISREGFYRTFKYQSDVSKCDGSRKMDIIAEFIAIQFDDGTTDCKADEWFPCGKVLHLHRLHEESK